MNPDLQLFVRDALTRGLPRAAIRERLLEAGWRAEEVESALAAYAEADFPVPVPRRRTYLSAREAFLYLVLFATLYIAAFNLGLVLFAILDRWMPDAVGREYAYRGAVEAIRNGIAGLVIAFPIFLFVSTLIGRAVAREPEKRGSEVRRWLTYITLFVAALVIIGDLTFLVQRLLSGELPVRVLGKTLVVFAIAGTIFGHYLAGLRGEEGEGAVPRRRSTWLAWTVMAAVAAAIEAGLIASGSPRQARLRALDGERVEELKGIWGQVNQVRLERKPAPATLAALAALPGAPPPESFRDPVTHEFYGYRVVDSLTVELCATFATADSSPGPGPDGSALFWRHPRGRHCFKVPLKTPRVLVVGD
jgi:MFS family permease